MREKHLKYLACPKCSSDLRISKIDKKEGEHIETGEIQCVDCTEKFEIIKFIPRFVSAENYAKNFGIEWLKHSKTQYDSFTHTNISEKRFFEQTKWPRDLKGEIILEAGGGSGRFTEQAIKTGAMVVSIDYSVAVEANYQSHGENENVLIAQGNIYQLPLRKNFFDKIYCIGVMQHLPDPKDGFMSLIPHLKEEGKIAIDIHRKTLIRALFYTKNWIRPFTRRMNPEKLYPLCQKWVNIMWPITRPIAKIPKIGSPLVKNFFFIADYTGVLPLSDDLLKEWAVLDTYDRLSSRYAKAQTLETVQKWFEEAGLKEIEVHRGYNGIEGRGTR